MAGKRAAQAAAQLVDELVTDPALDELAAAAAVAQAPPVLEYGRYKVFEAPDGGWVVARAVDTCERCQGCGCGDQADPIVVPAMVIRMAKSQGPGLLGKLKAMRSLNGG